MWEAGTDVHEGCPFVSNSC